jgi:pre-60S factor REI1
MQIKYRRRSVRIFTCRCRFRTRDYKFLSSAWPEVGKSTWSRPVPILGNGDMDSVNDGTESAVTCMACRVRLVSGESRREHYRSDMHRVNLQRKVAGMAPLTADDFVRRLEALRAEEDLQNARRQPRFCEVCSKKFSSERALANHVASRRHRDAVRARPDLAETPQIAEAMLSPVDSDEEEGEDNVEDGLSLEEELEIDRRIAEAIPFAATECVFDGLVCETVEENLTHMAKKYGFFVPYIEHLADSKALLEYIGQKVGIGYACVECDRAFTSVAAVQRHMIDKQHARMTSDEDVWIEEYAQFYDFDVDGNAGSIGGAGGDETDGWEEVDGPEAEETLKAMDAQLVSQDEKAKDKPSSKYEETQEEEVAMVIGTKVVGHRSLKRYYQQRGRFEDSRDAIVINKVANEYRMLGWKAQKMPDAKLRAVRMAAFRQNKRSLEVGLRNYYTRKAPLRTPMAVFNSGYRP